MRRGANATEYIEYGARDNISVALAGWLPADRLAAVARTLLRSVAFILGRLAYVQDSLAKRGATRIVREVGA
jgi:hypothetical protein